MKRMMLVAVLVLVGAAGCGSGDDASREDAHDVPGRFIDKSRPHVVAFNNHYGNVETKCDGSGHRIWMTSSDGWTVLPDPTCPGYKPAQEPAVVAAP